MKISTVQNSFAAGEVSPLVGGRSDTAGYQNGVEELLNMYCDSRGPAITRGGSTLIAQLLQITSPSIMRTIQARVGQSIIALIYEDKITFFTQDGALHVKEYISNGDFIDGDSFWNTILIGNGSSVEYNYRNTILDPGKGGDSATIRNVSTIIASANYTLRITLNDVYEFEYWIGDTSTNDNIIATTLVTTSEVLIDFTMNASTVFYISIRAEQSINKNKVDINNVSIYDQGNVAVEFTTPWLFSNKNEIRTVTDSSGKRAFFLHNETPMQELTVNADGTISFGPAVIVNPPGSWNLNSYPKVGVIHEGKLWVSNNTLEFWYSVSGDYLDFTTGILAAESGSLVIADTGVINWMETGKNLLIGTQVKEFIVNSQGGVIYVGDFSIQEQSSYGSAFVRPVKIGDLLIYVSPDRRKIRAMQFQFIEDQFLSTDLTFFSEHITTGRIKEIAWQQDPDNILWVLLEDGTYTGLTYERSNNVWGWHTHTTRGGVINMGAYTSLDQSDMIIYANRAPDSGVVTLSSDFINSIDIYNKESTLDGSITVTLDTPNTIVDGFDALFNNEGGLFPAIVHVFADGNYVGEMTIITPGRLIFTDPVTVVQAGYGFTQRLKTLPINKGGQNGASEAWYSGFNKLFIKIYDSFIPKINGIRPSSRRPSTPMNAMQGRTTEVLEVAQSGYNIETQVTIEQDLPRKLTVIYIAGELDQSQL